MTIYKYLQVVNTKESLIMIKAGVGEGVIARSTGRNTRGQDDCIMIFPSA